MSKETGWLIERESINGVEWFVGDSDMKFTANASKAMRFARPEDALLFVSQWILPMFKAQGWPIDGFHKTIRFTEHSWE